jgi:hypothetical protein
MHFLCFIALKTIAKLAGNTVLILLTDVDALKH